MTTTELHTKPLIALSSEAVEKVTELLPVEDQRNLRLRVAASAAGAPLRHNDGLKGAGFSINNPNTERSCGCGQPII